MKELTVVIPMYNETTAQLTPAFGELNNSVGIDWNTVEVLLVNDANPDAVPPESWLSIWNNLRVRTIVAEKNSGPGVARQIGIDNALGEYVMFIDADDSLHSAAVLGAFLECIHNEHPDLVCSPWIEEIKNPSGAMGYISHDNEQTWMFGKVYNRRWLQAANIRFHPELRVHEDSYFNSLAFALSGKTQHMPVISYIWRWNEGSTVRHDEGIYRYDSGVEFIKAHAYAFERLEKEVPDSMPQGITQLMAYHYATTQQAGWLEHKQYRADVEKALKEHFGKYYHYIANVSVEQQGNIVTAEITKHLQNDVAKETWFEWLNRMGVKEETN